MYMSSKIYSSIRKGCLIKSVTEEDPEFLVGGDRP